MQETTQGQWVSNHRLTDMWSSPADEPGAVSFGKTSRQFCVFEEREQRGDWLFVFNPYNDGYFWIDAKSVGPVTEPEARPRSTKPAEQNCSDGRFDG